MKLFETGKELGRPTTLDAAGSCRCLGADANRLLGIESSLLCVLQEHQGEGYPVSVSHHEMLGCQTHTPAPALHKREVL